MKHSRIQSAPTSEKSAFGMVLKGSTAMAIVALAVSGVLAPEIAQSGISWGQGMIALSGGILGAFLALRR